MWRPTRPPAQQCGDGGRDLDLIDQSGVSCRQGTCEQALTVFYLLPGSLPGAGVGGPGALTGGENRLPPVGLIDFSVGAACGGGAGVAGGAAVSVTVFVTVTVSGAGASLPCAGGEHAHGNDRAHACGRDEATSHSA